MDERILDVIFNSTHLQLQLQRYVFNSPRADLKTFADQLMTSVPFVQQRCPCLTGHVCLSEIEFPCFKRLQVGFAISSRTCQLVRDDTPCIIGKPVTDLFCQRKLAQPLICSQPSKLLNGTRSVNTSLRLPNLRPNLFGLLISALLPPKTRSGRISHSLMGIDSGQLLREIDQNLTDVQEMIIITTL